MSLFVIPSLLYHGEPGTSCHTTHPLSELQKQHARTFNAERSISMPLLKIDGALLHIYESSAVRRATLEVYDTFEDEETK